MRLYDNYCACALDQYHHGTIYMHVHVCDSTSRVATVGSTQRDLKEYQKGYLSHTPKGIGGNMHGLLTVNITLKSLKGITKVPLFNSVDFLAIVSCVQRCVVVYPR